MKLSRSCPPGWVRLWFWNLAGAQSTTVPLSRATEERYRLIAEGAVVYHTEVYP
jgi:hypothetical protein